MYCTAKDPVPCPAFTEKTFPHKKPPILSALQKIQYIKFIQTPDGEPKIKVRLENDTVWLSADQMAELFQRNKSTISRHINTAKLAKEKADKEYDKFKERTKNELSPAEKHFLENFEREQKKLLGGKGSKKNLLT